jgi:hypothetical protein
VGGSVSGCLPDDSAEQLQMESKELLSVGDVNVNRSLSQSCEWGETGMFSLDTKTWPGISIRAIWYSTKTSQSL